MEPQRRHSVCVLLRRLPNEDVPFVCKRRGKQLSHWSRRARKLEETGPSPGLEPRGG